MSNPRAATITVTPRGPYLVSGVPRIVTADGTSVPAAGAVALCRCGYSKTKPLCDGTHGPYQFSREPQSVGEVEPAREYRGRVAVRYQPAACAHLGVCTRSLPAVFNVSRRPWVDPDQAEPAQLIDTVDRCPSGALTMPGQDAAPHRPEPATIRALRDGPLAVEGDVRLDGIRWPPDTARHRFTLCRCGASRTMPFCDGSHTDVGFTAG